MKRTVIFSAWLLAVCIAVTSMFTACKANKPSTDSNTQTTFDTKSENDTAENPKTEEWIFTADNVEEAKEIYDSFLYMTIYEENMIVKISNGDGLFLTETIDGEKDHVEYEGGGEYFVYPDGGDYIYAVVDGNNKYYYNDKEIYDESGFDFLFYLDLFSDLPADGVTVSLTSRGTSTYVGYNIFIDATLTLEIRYNDNSTTSVTAVKVHDRVVSFKSVYTDADGSYPIEITFEFGNASVTIPDLTDWFNASAPRVASHWYVTGKVGGDQVEEIPMYFDCITGCYKTDYVNVLLGDNVTIKSKNDDAVSYSQKIDSDFLTGYEMIVFDPEEETISFESENPI